MKSCPQCNHELTAASEVCAECGFVLITSGSKTLGNEDTTREMRSDLPDPSAATLTAGFVSSSDSTVKPDTVSPNRDPASTPTIRLPGDHRPEASSNDDDMDFEVEIDADTSVSGSGDQTLLVDPMQTMSRPLEHDSFNATLPQGKKPKLPSTVRPPTARPSKTLPGQPLPTIVNPQAALDAAEEYSKGLQSLIPPRTIVRKEEASDSSDYQILKKIGSGAYGTVFRAKQVPLERSVAIKLLQNSTEDEQHQQRIKNEFLREAQFTGRLEHPNIVPIHDIGLTVSPTGKVNPFYVMKEIRGESWLSVIRTKVLRENLDIFKNVTNAIAFAHSQNILHCDLKPDNVMLGEFGEVLVVDWGQSVDLSVSETMRPGGTPAYISPEMAQYWIDIYLDQKQTSRSRENVGLRSDVYLLGALLFEIITGTAPHCKSTREPPYEVIRLAAKNHIVDFAEDVNKDLMNIALRALRATDDNHIETTSGLLTAIDQYETRSLSIELRQRAQQLLEQAKAEDDYDYFQRARFSFDEAIEKWEGNVEAREGLRDAKLSCAQLALNDQNFDLGLDVLEKADGEAETELRKQLTAGKQTRDRRKKLVAGLAFGLAASILAGILINAYMIRENYKSGEARKIAEVARDEAVIEKDEIEKSIQPMKAEQNKLKEEIAKFPVKLATQEKKLVAAKVKKERELNAAINELDEQRQSLVKEKRTLVGEKQTLAVEKENLATQVVDLNESSKLLRYKGGLTQIATELQSGDYRDARKGLAQYPNQQDWEVGRLNLLAHREIKSLYPSQPITSISATAEGQQVAIVFPDRIVVRSVDQLDQPGIEIDTPNITAVALSTDGNQLFAGKPGDLQDSVGQIEVFDLVQSGQAESVLTFAAQSTSIDLIQVSDAGNAVLSVGKTSALRQSSGKGLEEPLMVWIDGQKANVKLVLPNGTKPKFDSASFSNDGQRILLTNRTGLPRDQHAHVFERTENGYQWIASSPISGISAATFISGSADEVVAGVENANTGGYSLARWSYATPSTPSTSITRRSGGSGSLAIIAPLASKIIQLRQQGDFLVATENDRQTTVWDWRNKKSVRLKGQSRPADFGFVKPGERLEDCKVVTVAIGDQPELLSIDLADYQPEFRRLSIGYTPEDRPASVTAMFSPSANKGDLQAFGNDHGMASVFRRTDRNTEKNQVQWNISAWQYQIASDEFVFAQSAEDYLYQYNRTSGSLERVLTKLARYLERRERIVDLQVSDDGRVALVKTDSNQPKFLLWDLEQDRLIRKVDYGEQDVFGTGSKKLLPKLTLSRDGKWVIGAKVGVFGWPVNSGQLVRFTSNTASAARSIANSIVFVRNSQQVLVSWQNQVSQFDLNQQQQVASFSLPQISTAQVQDNLLDAIEDAGKIYILADKPQGGILLLSLENQKQIAEFERASFASFAPAKNGLTAIAGGLDETGKIRLEIWDPAAKSPKKIDLPAVDEATLNRHFIGFAKVSLSPQHGILLQTTQRNRGSADRMWSTIAVDTNLQGLDIETASFGRLRVLSKPTIKQVVANEKQAATLANGQVLFWKLSERSVKPDGVLNTWATAMQMAPDSNTLAICTSDNHCVLYDFSERKQLGQVELKNDQGDVTAIAWQADSQTLAIGRSTGVIEILELNKDNLAKSKSEILNLNTPIESVISRLAFAQNGVILATVADQGMAVLIRTEQKDAEQAQAPTQALNEMVFRYQDERTMLVADISADGNRVVSGSNTGRITIWNSQLQEQTSTEDVFYATAERELLSLPNLHQSPISVVRFADERKGKMIYSAEQDSGKNEFISWPSARPTVDALPED